MSLPTSLPTLASTWTAPASCFATTNYYRVLFDEGGAFFSNLYGTPTPVFSGNKPTGACFPPKFTINVPYLTDGDCPTGYTRACATAGPTSNGQPVSSVTCCPSVTNNAFSFLCRNHEYGCHATATEGAVWTGVITNIGLDTPTEEPVTRTPTTDEGLEAWGIKMLVVSPLSAVTSSATTDASTTFTSTTDSAETTTNSNRDNRAGESSRGLPTGTVVGIAVGAGVVVLILALGAFLLYRRRKQRQLITPTTVSQTTSPGTYTGAPAFHQTPQFEAPDAWRRPKPAWELQG